MPDRDTVIKRMETICNICKENAWRTEFTSDDIYPLLRDALALLKGHGERVKPRLSREWYICECGASITVEVDGEPLHKAKYCAECGRWIEWE